MWSPAEVAAPRQASHTLTWLLALAALCLSRLPGMLWFPLTDTTEARYAEVARQMVQTGDWITPWFAPAMPFWGKPPLSFWAQAISARALGMSELALRLPSWLAMLGVIVLVWHLARREAGTAAARWSTLILASMALPFVSAGAVMTDAFLVLGTTLSLVSLTLVVRHRAGSLWPWGLFGGLVIGLLAKGPVAGVLVALPLVLWLPLSDRHERQRLRTLPWIRGTVFMTALVVPWYVLAEIRTPGFLDYFVVGEHFRRFLDPGWAGDLYGTAHEQPKGMIWVFWLWASFPWGVLMLAGLVVQLALQGRRAMALIGQAVWRYRLLGICTLAPLIFFTPAGNTLWTYALPSLPFAAVGIGMWVATWTSRRANGLRHGLVMLVPIAVGGYVALTMTGTLTPKTEKTLVAHYAQHYRPGDSPLFYLVEMPFSASFYSSGKARQLTRDELFALYDENRYRRIHLAVPRSLLLQHDQPIWPESPVLAESRRYLLLGIAEPSPLLASLTDAR